MCTLKIGLVGSASGLEVGSEKEGIQDSALGSAMHLGG